MAYLDKSKQNAAIRRCVAARREETRDFIQSKKDKCSICGYNRCKAALHFHHIDDKDKLFDLSRAVRHNFGRSKIIDEINKCILVCSNCHAEIHYGVTST